MLPPIAPLRAEQGFTLIEVLVAISTSLVITLAAFGLLKVTADQTSRATDYVQASQSGRNALTALDDELNTACLSLKYAPVKEKSTGETLFFVDAYGSEAVLGKAHVVQHEIALKAQGQNAKNNYKVTVPLYKLVDSKRIAAGEETVTKGETTSKEYTFPEKANSETVLAERVAKYQTPEQVAAKKGAGEPFFKYYEYNAEATTGTTGPEDLKEIPASAIAEKGLTKEQADNVSAVMVSVRTLPVDREEELNRSFSARSQVTFAFSAPLAEPKISEGPCE